MLLVNNFIELAQNPTVLATLIAIFLFIILFIYISKIKITVKMIVHIGLTIALTVILHMIRIYHMPQGGSVTLGSMIPIILLAYYYKPSVGYLAGFLYGLINLIQDPFIIHPLQVIFDYPLPYMLLGIAGYFKKNIFLGATLAIIARFCCHFISGIVFFGDYAPEGTSVYLYSFLFNITYLLPELIITLFILYLLPIKRIFIGIK